MNVDRASGAALNEARAALRGWSEQRLCCELESENAARVRAAAQLLTEALVPLLVRVCRSRLAGRPREDAEDAASFASERLYARLLAGRHVNNVTALAVRVALNACADHYRGQYRRARETAWDAVKLDSLSAPDDVVQQIDDRLRLQSVVERMTPGQRAVAAGRVLGLASGEIGASIGKSANAIDAHRSRIRNTYSEEFDQ